METSKYPISKIEKPITNKLEQESNVPIIDIIRHGETIRKQNSFGFHKAPLLDKNNLDFKLDIEHLDLDEEGITSIKASANQLIDLIDKKNEIVLVVSSPSWRTHSSALVLEKILREKGVDILNIEGKPKFSKFINQHSSFFEKVLRQNVDDETTKEIIEYYIGKGWQEGLERAEKATGIDMLEKMQEVENLSFQRFLRHMNNIYYWLSSESLQKLKDKKLRIVVLAHEETTRGFIEETMPIDTLPQENGQILEIVPQSELLAGDKVVTNIKLYPKKERSSEKQGQVERGFNPN
jgi:broad specificity phosphatase PhoE